MRTVRPVALGALAVYFAVRGQGLVANLGTRQKGTGDYTIAVILILLAWIGTYRNRSFPGRAATEPARPWQVPVWRERAVVFLAIVVNVLSVVALRRKDYDSLLAGAVWLASLILLGLAAAGRRSRPAEARAAADGDRRWWTPRRIDLLLAVLFFLLGLALRIYRLGDWTTGMHGDEGEVGLNALEILKNPRAFSPFRTGWFGQPNFYYFGVAIGMKIFGTGAAGLRAFSAIAGAVLLVPFYFLVRRLFGFRAAVLASILLAVSGPSIHFSRQEFSNITTPLLLVTGFLFLARGFESRRLLPFVLAGYAHLGCLYFYLGGRLTPLIAGAFFAYLLLVLPLAGAFSAGGLRARFAEIRPLLPAAGFYAAAAFCMAGPWAAYYVDHRFEWDSRVKEKLIFNQAESMAQMHRARHEPLMLELPRIGTKTAPKIALAADGFWPRVLWGQLKATLSILTWNFDRSGVYLSGDSATTPLESVFVVFGIAWAVWRWRDGRMAMLSIWFWLTIVVGGVLTIDAPYLARLVGILPLLPIFSAIVLDKLALEVERLWRRLTHGSADDGRYVLTVAVLVLVAVLVRRSLNDYFVRFLGSRPFPGGISFASFVRDTDARALREGRPAPKYYALGAHEIYWEFSVNTFLNKESVGENMENPADALPLTDAKPRDAVFVVWDNNRQYLPMIKRFYPGGEEGPYLYGPKGREVERFQYYRVPWDKMEAGREILARYSSAGGVKIDRPESGPGSAPPPAGLRYPAHVEWTGQLVAPAFGRYRFELRSAGSASLSLDGTTCLTASEPVAETAVVLARGIHPFSIRGTLPDGDARIRLLWAVGDSDFEAVAPRFFWSGVGAAFMGQVRWAEGEQAAERRWTEYRKVPFLGFRDARTILNTAPPIEAVWKGTLKAPEAGTYVLETLSSGPSTVSVDGTVAVTNDSPENSPVSRSARVELAAGNHALEVSYTWRKGIGQLELYWQPPGGLVELLGFPEVSTAGGVWRPDEVREARPIPPEAIGAVPPTRAPSARPGSPVTSVPAPPRGDQRGCSLDSAGNLYVADAAGHRLAVVDSSGKHLASWGKSGRGPGGFVTTQDVAMGRDGRVAVLDSTLSRILIFTAGGSLAGTIEGVGCSPAGLAAGPDDSLYVASPCDTVVRKYSWSGELRGKLSGGSDPQTRLNQPVDVAVSPEGRLFVADLRDRIVEIDPSRDAILTSWPVHVGRGFGAAKLEFSKGTLFLTDPDRDGLFAVDTASGKLRGVPKLAGPELSEFARQAGVAACVERYAAGALRVFPGCGAAVFAYCREGPAPAPRPSPQPSARRAPSSGR